MILTGLVSVEADPSARFHGTTAILLPETIVIVAGGQLLITVRLHHHVASPTAVLSPRQSCLVSGF